MSINIAKIYSILGSENFIVPLAVKDSFSSLGMTSGSFITGQEEGYDRFIDEVGTEIVWLGGVPIYKWLFDKTVFNIYGLDSKYDARNLKNKDIFKRTKKNAPDEDIKKAIEKIEKKQKIFKNLAASKFILSTSLAIMSYIMLTKYKQKYTEKQIKKKLINEYQKKQNDDSSQGEKIQKNTDSPSFKSLGSMTESLAYNSVKNMWIVDGAITSERLLDSRNPQEFIGYAIKEAFSLCFLYYAGGKIQKFLENNAMKKHNRNIALDARVLENNYIKQIFKDGTIKSSLDAFDKIKKDPIELYDFLHKNPNNAIVKIAKQSDIIVSYKNTDKIDTRAYIDLEKIETLKKDLNKLYEQYKEAAQKGENTEKFFKKVKKLKRCSIITNIGTSIFALGILAPGVMLIKRKFFDQDSEFQTKRDIRNQMIKDGIIN